ncbi:PREDICTED: uncharacterized protein LOC109163772 [Ipomoea nil]|uniref:uncharacterized protein LOC109163772 n=1 Tax=Ipomoea nil TaxID=35883 RepID=UPI000901D5E9|nr:PREDICTED: uncharacterized protein LOC109163772 [Ipomoea nil]
MFVKKFKRFMRKNNPQSSLATPSSSIRRNSERSNTLKSRDSEELQSLCYNCRKPGHCKAECPYLVVRKHQDKPRSAGNSSNPRNSPGETSGRSANNSSSHTKGDRRIKALVIEESVEKATPEQCTSSSSSESESSGDEKGLICLYNQQDSDEDLCLMTKDEEYVKNTHAKFKEEDAQLLAECESIKSIVLKNNEMMSIISQFEKQILSLKEE